LEGRAELILGDDLERLRHEDVRERLYEGARRVRVPTLVVRGARSDLVSPEGVKEFVEVVPGARYVDVADAGHMVAGDQNDHFASAILDFLDRLVSSSDR
jgi:pimeloyl-ACP methyl ester carboxylesterase